MVTTSIVTLALALAAVSASEVCYDGLPCFSTGKPWHTLLRLVPAPDSPLDIETHFTLYSRTNTAGHRIEAWPQIVLDDSAGYNGSQPTFFITHGYFNNGNFTWMAKIKDQLLNMTDGNVIIVGWGKGSLRLNYYQSVANTRVVGAELTRIGKYLMSNHSADPATFHLIGHSLGAHVMAYMGKTIANIGRITALDPAQPGYEGYSCEVRLCAGDATFVQAIHTDAKPFVPYGGLGFMEAVADVDFYMNGGWKQPGCLHPNFNINISSLEDWATLPAELIAGAMSCDHLRSIEYFLSSLRTKNCTFWGYHTTGIQSALQMVTGGLLSSLQSTPTCTISTCSRMGVDTADYPARGSFLINTSSKTPFCILDKKNDLAMAAAMLKSESPN